MADYYARKYEVATLFDKAMVGKFEPWRAGLGTPLADVMNARSTALNAYVTALCDDTDEDIAKDVDEKVQYGLTNAVRPISDIGKTIKDLDADLMCFVEQVATQEAKFFAGLGGMQLGPLRDRMREIDVDLKQLIAILSAKWATMSEANQRLEKIEADLSAKMTEAMATQAGKSADYLDQAAEAVGRIVEKFIDAPKLANEAVIYLAKEAGVPDAIARRIPDVKDFGKYIYGGAALSNDTNFTAIEAKEIAKVGPMFMRDCAMVFTDKFKELFPKEYRVFLELAYKFYKEVIPYYRAGYRQAVADYQASLPNQGSVLVSLSQTRADVATFLNICGLDQLKKAYETAIGLLDLWLGNASTDGQRTDAQAVRDAVKAMFDRRFQATTHLFEEFVRAEQGRFVGTVRDETANALLWTPMWVDREKGIVAAGMCDKLRTFRSTSLQFTGTLDAAVSNGRDMLRQSLPGELGDQAVAALDAVLTDVRKELKDANDATAAVLDEAATTASPDAVKRDLDRTRLQALVAAG